MERKTAIKLVSGIMLASVAVAALASARTTRFQEDVAFDHPLPPEVVKAMDVQDKRAQAAETQARQFLKARRFEDAKQAFARSLTLWSKVNGKPFVPPSTYQLLGDINREQEHYRDAINAYLKTRAPNGMYMTSEGKQIDLNIALCYLKMGNLTNAHKFYNEDTFFKGGVGASPAAKAQYMAQLPGTQTARAMEASLYYARGCEKSTYGDLEGAVADFEKVLVMLPRNALAADQIASAWDSLGSMNGTPYWARAAVFGKGEIAHEAQLALGNRLMPDKVEQVLDEARKIQE